MHAFDYNKFLSLLVVAGLLGGLSACTEYGVENHDGENSTKGYFILYPNTHQLSDSIDERISKEGVRTRLSPGGHYSLFAKIDSLDVVPILFISGAKCCENGCLGINEGDNFKFDFSCLLDEPSYAILSLKDQNHNTLKASVSHVRLDGEGIYSDYLSLNIVVAGAFDSTADGQFIDSLANGIGQRLQQIYDVHVDTVYISYAINHPSAGRMFAKDSFLFVGSSYVVNLLREPWNDSEKDKAFDVVLVDRVNRDVVGYAYNFFFQESLNLEVSVVSFRRLDGIPYFSQTIQNISVHELGHVLGLNHTTLTMKDFLDWGDYSIFEDGLEDTPYCQEKSDQYREELEKSVLKKSSLNNDIFSYMAFPKVMNKLDTLTVLSPDCSDYFNIMSPWGIFEKVVYESSPMQRAIVKKNLTLIPH